MKYESMNDITPEPEAKLRGIGWSPERRVPDAQIDAWLRMAVQEFGCHIFPEAVRVLRGYGDLVFGDLHFSPEGSTMRGDASLWLYWEWQENEVLFPIAYTLGDCFTFALSSTGKVYGRGVRDIYCGDSFEEFLSNMLAFNQGRIKWADHSPIHWTPEMDADFERMYDAVYAKDQRSGV